MKRHRTKEDFPAVEVTVIALNFLASFIFLASVFVTIFSFNGAMLQKLGLITDFNSFNPLEIVSFGLGGLFAALVLFAIAELLQLIMKMEHTLNKLANDVVAEEKAIPAIAEKKPVAKKVTTRKRVTKKTSKSKKKTK